jgi:hypothetical protein
VKRIVVVALSVLAIGALIAAAVGYLAVRSDLNRTRAQTRKAAGQIGDLRKRVEELIGRHRAQTDRLRLVERRARDARGDAELWASAQAESQASIAEILRILPAFGVHTSRSCRGSVIGSVRVQILSPRPGETAAGPVVAHIVGADPFFCDATFFITVDGVPYEALPAANSPSETARNPFRTRALPRLPRSKWSGTCISGSYAYLRFELKPGPHVLRVHGGCPQGTDVPATIPTSVRFVVAPG